MYLLDCYYNYKRLFISHIFLHWVFNLNHKEMGLAIKRKFQVYQPPSPSNCPLVATNEAESQLVSISYGSDTKVPSAVALAI